MVGKITFNPVETDDILLNPGTGIMYVLRGTRHVHFDQSS